jgi:deglycase
MRRRSVRPAPRPISGVGSHEDWSELTQTLEGRKVAIIATDGVEQVELVEPRRAVERAGATTELLSLETGQIQAMNSDIEPADRFTVDRPVKEASPDQYDGLILPGGTVNADRLRADHDVVSFVRDYFKSGKPVGVICHGPWTLVEADLVRGRTLTSYPTLRTDIRNAGGTAVDQEVVVDEGLVSSRSPGDLPAFCIKIVEEFADGERAAASAHATSVG